MQRIAETDVQGSKSEVTFDTVRAYLDAVLSDAALKAATESVKSAESDLERAQSIYQAGMSTDADVLSIRVHLARSRSSRSGRGLIWRRHERP
jgi:outer membrane protein TolC